MTNAMSTVPTVPVSPDFVINPPKVYAELREMGPVVRALVPNQGALWLVTRYADVRKLFGDRRLCRDLQIALSDVLPAESPVAANLRALTPAVRDILMALDPPDHTRLRKFVHRAFTPRHVEMMRPAIKRMAAELLDDLAGAESADLMATFAKPITDRVNAALLGTRLSDAARLREWTGTFAAIMMETPENTHAASAAMEQYLVDLVAEKRAAPGDDLTSALIRQHDEHGDMSETELLSLICTMYIASSDTIPNFIGNGILALLQNPDQLEKLRANTDLMPAAVEELLRYDGSINMDAPRYTTEPVEVDGVTIPAGEIVMLTLHSANRDPERFPDPDRLDITRKPNGHVAFGHGASHCVGAGLSRLVGEIAFEAVFERFPALKLDVSPAELPWQFNLQNRGLMALPVRLTDEPPSGPSTED